MTIASLDKTVRLWHCQRLSSGFATEAGARIGVKRIGCAATCQFIGGMRARVPPAERQRSMARGLWWSGRRPMRCRC
jgi:hypothetical protein